MLGLLVQVRQGVLKDINKMWDVQVMIAICYECDPLKFNSLILNFMTNYPNQLPVSNIRVSTRGI